MRIALFVTCLADALFPRAGQATVALLERLGHEVVFPADQTCCGQMHVNTGYQREALPLVRHHVEVFERGPRPRPVRGDRRAVGLVRRARCATSTRWWPAAAVPGTSTWRVRAEAVAAQTFELSRAAGRRARRRPTSAPTSRTGSPTTRPATRCGCCGSATSRCGCCARCAASTWSSCPTPTSAAASAARSRSRTPTPRRRCWPTRCARCWPPGPRCCTAGDTSCLMHIGGGLSRLRAGTRTVHLAEILAADGREATL